jgi:hypothetical protein
MTVTNQNLIQEEIKRRLNSGNACYHSVQNLLFSRLLSRNLKIWIYKTIILPVVLYGCETWYNIIYYNILLCYIYYILYIFIYYIIYKSHSVHIYFTPHSHMPVENYSRLHELAILTDLHMYYRTYRGQSHYIIYIYIIYILAGASLYWIILKHMQVQTMLTHKCSTHL